jgi:DNA polymerase-1
MNYGIVYGMGSARAARELGVATADAAAYIERYLGRYPGVRAFMEATIGEARTRGYVTTVLGRRRYLPELGSRDAAVRQFAERAATNTPIQGSAADLIKLAMLEVRRRLAAGGTGPACYSRSTTSSSSRCPTLGSTRRGWPCATPWSTSSRSGSR